MKKSILRLWAAVLSAMTLMTAVPAASAESYTAALSSASLRDSAEVSFDDISNNRNAIAEGLDNFKTTIQITGYLTIDDVIAIFNDITKDYNYFYVCGIREYTTYDDMVSSITVSYATNKSTYNKVKNKTIKKIEEIINSVDSSWTDIQKVAYIHDRIITSCAYKTDVSYEDSSYGVFVKGAASCEGYSKAFRQLLTAIGIECDLVRSESMVHMWNMVKLNGKWYHVDVTYDDPVFTDTDVPSASNGQAYHTYFLKSDKGLKDHSDWTASRKCTSRKYDKVTWNNSNTPFTFYKNKIIYSTSNGVIKSYDLDKGVISKVTSVSDKWKMDINSTQYVVYDDKFVGVYVYAGKLYYNTSDSVMSYDLKTGETRTVCKIDKSKGLPTGVTLRKNEISCYFAGADENAAPKAVGKVK